MRRRTQARQKKRKTHETQRGSRMRSGSIFLVAITMTLFYGHSLLMPIGRQTLLLQLSSQIKLQLEVEKGPLPLSDLANPKH
jgi:hypothetical protein